MVCFDEADEDDYEMRNLMMMMSKKSAFPDDNAGVISNYVIHWLLYSLRTKVHSIFQTNGTIN